MPGSRRDQTSANAFRHYLWGWTQNAYNQ